jgi:hypothetical protein
MHAAKARGEIAKFPNGRRAKSLPPLSKDRKIRKAQRLLEAAMAKRKAEKAAVPATVTQPWQGLDKAGKLSEMTDQGLDELYAFLMKPVDPEKNEKLYLAKISTALSVVSAQIRLDAAALMARSGAVLNEDERARLDWAHRRWAMLAAEEAEKVKEEVDVLLPPAAAE